LMLIVSCFYCDVKTTPVKKPYTICLVCWRHCDCPVRRINKPLSLLLPIFSFGISKSDNAKKDLSLEKIDPAKFHEAYKNAMR